MRRLTDEEWPDDVPLVDGLFFRGLIAGLLLSWPFWLGAYLLWRWLS